MAEGKSKYLEDAALVIDGRVAALEAEYEVARQRQSDITNAADRAAIAEARLCAKLIRSLGSKPYRGCPYSIATARLWVGKGPN